MPNEGFAKQSRIMAKSGYCSGAPSELSARVGVAVCSRATCDNCEKGGLEYFPYYHLENKAYRAFAVCGDCGWFDEF